MYPMDQYVTYRFCKINCILSLVCTFLKARNKTKGTLKKYKSTYILKLMNKWKNVDNDKK